MDELSRLDIDLSAVERNLARLRQVIGPHCNLCPVVKADGYGLGARRIVPAMESAGAGMFAVYTPREAAELLSPACRLPILILMPVRHVSPVDPLHEGIRTGQVHFVVHDADHLDCLQELAIELDLLLHLHLKVDTGMHRGGCPAEAAPVLLDRIVDHRQLHLAGVYTHFSSSAGSDETTIRQRAVFDAVLDACIDRIDSDCLVHCANTAAVFRGQAFHRSMVRVGLGWAGACPPGSVRNASPDAKQLEPVVRWTSRVIQVREVEEGDRVGYDGLWKAQRNSVIGVVPVGYADGYPPIPINSHDGAPERVVGLLKQDQLLGYAPVIGTVSMDQVIVDLTDMLPLPGEGLGIGVELLSRSPDAPNGLLGLSASAGMKPHALLSCLHARIPRRYEGDVALVETLGPEERMAAG
ncbi:MAG: alanine racemase [Phycisphaerae bacterium]|nr:alanine racemase [Phycisphaerae bacterium]